MKAEDVSMVELAAKAAGYVGEWKFFEAMNGKLRGWYYVLGDGYSRFNPLEDDGDALRLAVKLKIRIGYRPYAYADTPSGIRFFECADGEDADSRTRRAIVRAAAEIGRVVVKEEPFRGRVFDDKHIPYTNSDQNPF